MSENKTPKAKNLMYAQQLRHLPQGIRTAEDLAELIETKLNPVRYAVIIHDQETDDQGQPKEPDIHAMMSFENARYCSAIAKKLGDKPQYVQAWEGSANNGYAYLVHATTQAQRAGKHRYDLCAVLANFDFPDLMGQIGAEIVQAKADHRAKTSIKAMLDALYVGAITKSELEKQLSGSQYARYHRQIEDVDAKRMMNEAEKWREEMRDKGAEVQVIWLTGPAGTGKTSLAKAYAEKKGQPYFIAGSSRDIFQGYAGEHTLILDELRPKVITYADLLRITDPFSIGNRAMAPARYSDKALVCDLIIITTPFTPSDFYFQQFNANSLKEVHDDCPDGLDQLLRRITVTLEMTGKTIEVSQYNIRGHMFQPVPGTARPNPYSRLARPAPKNKMIDFYNSMFTDIEEN